MLQSLGRNIQLAAVIVLVDAKPSGSPAYRSVLEFREFIKGRAGPTERTISIRLECWEGASIQPGVRGAALLLPEGWQRAECPVLAAYQEPAEVAAVRSLTRIYTLPSERGRLEALRALLNDPNTLFRDQLFDDLTQMREPANFQMVLDVFDAADAAGQRRVVQILEGVGDLRGVPTLLKALASPDRKLQESADAALASFFRGAPGVDEAVARFRKQAPHEPETRFQAATLLWESGRRQRGRLLFLAVARDRRESEYVRVQSALTVAATLSESERRALQVAMRPLLARLVTTGNDLRLLDAAKILRALRSQKNLDLLMALLDRRQEDFVYHETPFIATQAIRELGPLARRRAADRLLARIEAIAKTERITGEPQTQLLALAWLGDFDHFGKIEEWRWNPFRPLIGVGQQQDEGLFLIHVLQNPADLPLLAQASIVFRLGDLRERRSIPDLVHVVITSDGGPASPSNALVQIAGPLVESEATKLLSHPIPDVRQTAIDILYRLQGAKMLPLLRRMIVEKDFGVKSQALFWIGHVGEAEDLKWLIPMADFWTGDRPNHYWAMLAVAEIRSRRHYDLRGASLPLGRRPPSRHPPV